MKRPILLVLMALALFTWTGCTDPDEGSLPTAPRATPSSSGMGGIIK